MPSQTNITNIPSSRVDFIDQRTGLMSREWYRFFLNLFNLTGAGNNPTSLDDLQVGPPTGSGEGGNSGTVTSVQVSGGTTGLTTSGGPITSAGTITLAGTLAVANGGTGSGTAGGARTNLGATTVGSNLFTLTNPSAVTFPQFNADNTVSALTASAFRTAIGAGTGAGSVTFVDTAGSVSGLTLTGGPITTTGTITLGGTLDLSSPPTIGNTTPNTGTFTTLIGGGGSANYGQLTGGATTKAVEFKTLGSDTNVALAIRTQGTGAIDLAAGSRGVNISNGGTVTAITRTATGSGYSYPITITVSAPTTAGGVQAQVSLTSYGSSIATVVGGGTGYTNGDVLTIVGGTPSGAATYTVTGVSGGVITSVAPQNSGAYTTPPSNPVSVTGGTGTGATLNLTYYVPASFSITNAGSGYVEQPTVTFSGGGGSGAAAYATVGSGTVVRSIGSTMSFYTPSSELLRLTDNGVTNAAYENLISSASTIQYTASGANATIQRTFVTKGAAAHNFATNGSSGNQQLAVAHTASAVNYVQVTGAATTTRPSFSASGSDTNVGISYITKGAGQHVFSNGGQYAQLRVNGAVNAVNYLQIDGSLASAAPVLSAQGSDTNIDLALTPKGTGNIVAGAGAFSGTHIGTWTGSAIGIAYGGTGQTTAAAGFNALSPVTSTGDLIVGNGTNSSTRLPIGTNGYVLTSNGTTATWAASTGGVTSFSAGTTGFTPSTGTTGAVTLAGTLNVANGGTGLTSLTTTYIPYGNGTSALSSTASLAYTSGTGSLTAPIHNSTNGITVNSNTVSASYTIAAGSNGMSAGPVTIASGQTVTIASGSRWVVV
jgi:hypothetical protein